jgi:O-antigen ligase
MIRRLGEHTRNALPAVFLVFAILLGGASGPGAGSVVNAFLQILALVLILYALWVGRKGQFPGEAKPLFWLAGLYLAAVLVSLIPLPPGLWQTLPGRETAARGLALIGLGSASLPHSLDPQSTLASLPWMLPPLAAFLLVLEAPLKARRIVVGGILGASILSVALGAAQLLSGPGALRPYEITNFGSPVGLFANANHLATLLLCSLPFAGYLAARAVQRRNKAKRASGVALGTMTGLFLVIGIGIIGSMAGYGLLVVILAATLLIYRRAAVGSLSKAWVGGAAVLFALFLGVALAGPLQEQALTGKLSDQRTSRKVMAATTIEAIKDTFPAGTGLGTMPRVYRTYEDQFAVGVETVNHTHNDYLEFVLELGVAGLLLILGFIIWWAHRSVRVWRSSFEGGDIARAGSVVVLVVLLHSIVDYPVRTSAIAVLVATACAMMVPLSVRRRKSADSEADVEDSNLRHLEAD